MCSSKKKKKNDQSQQLPQVLGCTHWMNTLVQWEGFACEMDHHYSAYIYWLSQINTGEYLLICIIMVSMLY